MCDFNCQDAFRVFDLQQHGFFGITQLKEGLGDLGVYATFDEIELMFKRYDRDADGRLNYKEFEEAVMPTDPYYLGCLEKRRGTHTKINPYRRDDIFCHQTGCAFTALFRAHL
jgi:hypothetical protein